MAKSKKKVTKKMNPKKTRAAKKLSPIQRIKNSFKRSPKKSLFTLTFALVALYFVTSVLAASFCPPTSGSGSKKGSSGAPGSDSTCIASASNNYCSGASGSNQQGAPGAPGQGQDVKTAPGADGADGADSADGVDGTPSAPGADGAPGTTNCTYKVNGVEKPCPW